MALQLEDDIGILKEPAEQTNRLGLIDDVGILGFDPEGPGYDYPKAREAGLGPDPTGHWPSRDPKTGLILKGRGHTTFDKTIEGEKKAGFEIYQGDDNRYYSRKKEPALELEDDIGIMAPIETPLLERLGKGFAMGVVGTVEGMAGALQAFGGMEQEIFGKLIEAGTKRAKESLSVPDPKFIDQVAAGFGSMSTFLIPGMGVAKGVKALQYFPRLAAGLGIATSSVLESTVEGGSAYLRAKEKRMSEEEAKGAAAKDFWLNLPVLVFTNKLGIFADKGGLILKGLKSAPLEAIQEFTQQIIGNLVVNDPLMQGALESAAVGGIVGGGTGMVVGGVEALAEAKKIKAKSDKILEERGVEIKKEPLAGETEREIEGVEPSRKPGEIVRDVEGKPVEIDAREKQPEKAVEILPETGTPLSISYGKNPEKAADMGTRFAQDIEPKGEYIIETKPENVPEGWEKGTISFTNPLVVEHITTAHGGWKTKLFEKYGGKKGESLTNAMKEDGYDGIITVNSETGETVEIVNIDGEKKPSEKPAEPSAKKAVPEPGIAEKVPPAQIPQGEQALVEEAKKYKTAEEFAVAQSIPEMTVEDVKQNDLGWRKFQKAQETPDVETIAPEESLKKTIKQIPEDIISIKEDMAGERRTDFKKGSTPGYPSWWTTAGEELGEPLRKSDFFGREATLKSKSQKGIFARIEAGEELTEKQQNKLDILRKHYGKAVKTIEGGIEDAKKDLSESEAGEVVETFEKEKQVEYDWDGNIIEKEEIAEPEGKERVRGLPKSVKKQAILEGLVEDLGDLPTYQTRNMDDVAERASEFINTDYELAKKIALREAPEQGDLRAEELFTAIRIKAVAEEDVDTIRDLATSEKAATAATEAGQRIKALDSSNENDPVKVIKSLTKERKEVSKRIPSDKKEAQIASLQKKLEELEEKVKTIESDLANNKSKRKAGNKKPFGSKNKVFTEEGLEEARAALRGKLFGLHAGVDPTAVLDLTKIGGFYFEGGVRNFSAWSKTMVEEFGNRVRPYLRKVWGNIQKQYNESKVKELKEKIADDSSQDKSLKDIQRIAQRLAEHLVSGGIVKRDNLVSEVQGMLKEYYPSVTLRETADFISGYGQYRLLDKSNVKKILRDIKGQLQQISKLEDLRAKKSPLKTGMERRAISDEERRLIKVVEDAKRQYGIKLTDPSTQLKTALDSYKTALKNQIKDLSKQITDRKKIVKVRHPLQLDNEAKALMKIKDILRKQYITIFGRKQRTLQERIDLAERAIQKSIEEYSQRIEAKDFSPMNKTSDPISTPTLDKMRTERENLRKQYKELKTPRKSAQEIGLQSLKTRLENETKRIESRLEDMDFEEIQKREIILDGQTKQLKEKRDRAKTAYKAAKEVKGNLTREEMTKIVNLSKKASEAKDKLIKSNDWTADNAEQVENYFYRKEEFEEYILSLKPIYSKDIVNNFVDYLRASILASPRILRNSFLYQVIPGIERTITKRLVTGVFNDADINSGIIEKIQAKLSGIKTTKKDIDFIKRQVAMAIRIYHKTGYDISRMDRMDIPPKYFGEHVGKIRGKSIFAKYAKIVNLAPKWMAGGTDMLFANIGRADTAILMSKERAHIESVKGILPEGVSEQERADQLLKDSYSFSPSENASNQIREAGIRDAHMMNNTQPGWWSDKVIEFRRMLSIGGINFGKALIPFAKITNVVVAEGVKTASGYGIAKSLYDINQSAKETDLNKRAKSLSVSVNNLVRYAGLTGAALVFAAFLDDDDFVGEWSVISKKEYLLARARGAGASYVKIGGKWIALRFLPMINIPISAIMTARQAKARKENVATAYISGIVGGVMSAPGVKESQVLLQRIGWSLKTNNMEKIAKTMKMDWESMTNWGKVRMIPSVLSYDIWNALFPKNSKYDFMGREIEKTGVFKNDTTNDTILEYERLAKTGNFPVISDPSGEYANKLEEILGEEEYQKILNEYKKNYASEVSALIVSSHYKVSDDKRKKKKIDRTRTNEISSPIRNRVKKFSP